MSAMTAADIAPLRQSVKRPAQLRRLLAVMAASLGVAACGGSTAMTLSPSASVAPTPTPTPAASPLVVWAGTTGSSKVIRTLTPAGGVVHTIATIPAASQMLGVGAGKL